MKRYPPTLMATCCVPWNEDYSFAEETFRRQVRLLVAHGYTDLYVFGTAGEGHAVDDAQFDEIGLAFHDELQRADLPARIGVISTSLRTVLGRIERARGWGVRRFQVSLPSWGALSDRELPLFFRETCGRFPDCEFMHYNLPRAGRVVTPREYYALAEEHPNLVATKHGGLDSVAGVERLLREAPQLQHFLGERGFGHGSLVGECGLLISVAQCSFAAGQAYYAAGRRRDVETLLAMGQELSALTQQLHALVAGVAHIDGAYDQLFCKLHDPEFPLRLLPPYLGAGEAVFEAYRTLLRERFPLWIDAPPAPGSGPSLRAE